MFLISLLILQFRIFSSLKNILFFGANGVATVVSTWFKRTFPEINARVSSQNQPLLNVSLSSLFYRLPISRLFHWPAFPLETLSHRFQQSSLSWCFTLSSWQSSHSSARLSFVLVSSLNLTPSSMSYFQSHLAREEASSTFGEIKSSLSEKVKLIIIQSFKVQQLRWRTLGFVELATTTHHHCIYYSQLFFL